MHIGFITIGTDDIDGSIGFYRDVMGLELLRRFSPGPDTDIAFLGDGESCEVELIRRKGAPASRNTESSISIGFRVRDIDETKRHLDAHGVPVISGPTRLPNGVRLMAARDPNGVSLGFVQEPQENG